jgi:hypothetical protein
LRGRYTKRPHFAPEKIARFAQISAPAIILGDGIQVRPRHCVI